MKQEEMSKRSADSIYGGPISSNTECEAKPASSLVWESVQQHLAGSTSQGKAVCTPGTARPVALSSSSSEPKRVKVREFKQSDTRTEAMVRAESIRAGLRPDLPSLVKFMHPSSCSGGFSLSLSIKFCQHLPPEDCEVVLEDEEGQLTRTKYLAVKKALSAGWRGFSIAHQLLPGDVAVFQLVAPCRMKVHIVRASSCPAGAAEVKNTGNRQEADRPPGLAMVVYKEDKQGNGSADVTTDECFNCSPAGSETIDGIRFSESNITFKEVTSFQDFHIAVNGLIIDCEFSPDTRLKYYELCKTRSMFLHEHLLEGINCKLAAGIIIETVNIADAVQAAGPSTPEEDVAVWNKTLEAVGGLGMSVEFLRERLSCRVGRVSEADKHGDALQVKHWNLEVSFASNA